LINKTCSEVGDFSSGGGGPLFDRWQDRQRRTRRARQSFVRRARREPCPSL